MLVSGRGQSGVGLFAAGRQASSSGGAMGLRVTRNMKINTANNAKVSMTGAKRVPAVIAAASKPGLRPRTTLRDIANKVNEQVVARVPLKKELNLHFLETFQLKYHQNL